MKYLALALFVATGRAANGQAFPLDVSDVKVSFSGFLHADAVLLDQSALDELDPATRQPLNTEHIAIRRAHARLDASKGRVGVWLELDLRTLRRSELQLFAAEVTAHLGEWTVGGLPPLLVGIGLTRIPFGQETRQHDLDRPFLEQSSLNRALFPGSMQLGLRARGAWRFLRYDAAVMTGEPQAAGVFALAAPTHSLEFVGRGGIFAELAPGVTLEAGLSGLDGQGFHAGSPTTKGQLVWRDEKGDGLVQLPELQAIPGTAAEPSSTFRRFALGADAHLKARLPHGLLVIGGEVVWAQNLDRALYVSDPVATGRNQRGNGFSASVVLQKLPWNLAAGVRYDRYNPDADASDHRKGSARLPASCHRWRSPPLPRSRPRPMPAADSARSDLPRCSAHASPMQPAAIANRSG